MALRPPKRFAEPGRICSVVTPPASCRGNCGSCGHTECSAHTYGVAGFVASLPSLEACVAGAAYTPRCEWTSMIPGVTYFPVPSMTTASLPASCVMRGSFALFVTSTIFPSFITIAPRWIVGPAAVRSVTFLMTVGREGKGLYVLGYGSAFGNDRAPGPTFAT